VFPVQKRLSGGMKLMRFTPVKKDLMGHFKVSAIKVKATNPKSRKYCAARHRFRGRLGRLSLLYFWFFRFAESLSLIKKKQ
jgi:hypothetical protein